MNKSYYINYQKDFYPCCQVPCLRGKQSTNVNLGWVFWRSGPELQWKSQNFWLEFHREKSEHLCWSKSDPPVCRFLERYVYSMNLRFVKKIIGGLLFYFFSYFTTPRFSKKLCKCLHVLLYKASNLLNFHF